MQHEVTNIDILSTGKIFAMMYLIMALVFSPFLLLPALLSDSGFMGVGFTVFMLLLYPILGFIGGMIFAVIYNVSARIVGGLSVTLQ